MGHRAAGLDQSKAAVGLAPEADSAVMPPVPGAAVAPLEPSPALWLPQPSL